MRGCLRAVAAIVVLGLLDAATARGAGRDVRISAVPARLPQAGVVVAEDPANPRHLVVAFNDYNARQGMSVAVSDDAGAAWTQVQVPRLPQQYFGDPQLAYGQHGIVYLAGTAYDGAGKPLQAVRLSINLLSSLDGGRTWHWLGQPSGPVPAPPVLDDYPALAVDPRNGSVSVAWTRIVGNDSSIAVARSGDSGRTFGKPLVLPGPWAASASMVLTAGGDPVVAFMDRQRARMSVALLHGDTLRAVVTVAPLQPMPPKLQGLRFRVASRPSLAIDRVTGRIYLVWPVEIGQHSDMALYQSADGGMHWRRVGQPAVAAGSDVFMPAAAVSPRGVVGLLWYERQGPWYRARLAFAARCAARFAPPVTLSSEVSSLYDAGPSYLGDYGGLVLDAVQAHGAWTDNRSLTPAVYTAAVPIPAAVEC